ncbi:MAG: amidase, partial [Pseudomonadota bacterium]|nr:amidase [Pseudomonadota bacterium]
ISALQLTDLFLDRIRRLNGVAKAFITVTEEEARREAAACDSTQVSATSASLRGIPFAVKDLIDIKGVTTTGGSAVLADNVATEDAFLIARMRAAGAISLGKLNLHEFAYGATGENKVYGAAANAYDPTRLAGGSSSGSAAAIAFGLIPAAFGTDTGGSVRVPAALSGLVGLKPTMGRISTRGVLPFSWTLDHVGILTRTIADSALILREVAAYDELDPGCADEPAGDYSTDEKPAAMDIRGLRVGIPRKFFFERADSEILSATEAVLHFLESRGAVLNDIELPSMEHARTVSLTIQMPEALSFHSQYLMERGHLYGTDFRAGLALGQCLLAEHYVRARRFLARYRHSMNAIFSNVDVLVTPTTPCIAMKVGETKVAIDGIEEGAGNAVTRLTTFFNLTGHPALTLPSGLHSLGLPMGVQLIGRYFEEATIFRVAAAVESQETFRIALPPVK